MAYTRYDFKMFIGNTKNVPCFRAYVVEDEDFEIPTIEVMEVEGFGINDVYESLFYEIVEGKLSFDLMKKRSQNCTTEIDFQRKVETIKINEGSAIKNLREFEKYSKVYFGVTTESIVVNFEKPFELRYDGYGYNIGHGLPINRYEQIEEFTKTFVSCLSSNNTSFGNMYRKIEKAGSTVIPFETEKKDDSALETIKNLFKDINEDNINYDYINKKGDNYSQLYKKLLLKLPEIRKVDDLHTFQIIIDGKKYNLDINKAKKVKLEEFGVPVSWTCKYLFSKGILKSDTRYHSIDVEYMKKRQTFHIEVENERILKLIGTLNNGDLINISGITFSQRTIIIDRLEKCTEKKL
ncbi:hypothetical protein HOO34_00520 [Aliarcobacter cryaerophilus]|uniref:Uncharacterized protein n=1 Tax=Aliarcobacter cryaerophilus TaxID=28198 RepID=A0A7G9LNR0_9BACT|nr:hypothetical protein [Aliarcobacter cryaerophilus]QNM90259.1 hypothetical protein HOO34_00520 [Aliarcobacter cryaerophilus]